MSLGARRGTILTLLPLACAVAVGGCRPRSSTTSGSPAGSSPTAGASTSSPSVAGEPSSHKGSHRAAGRKGAPVPNGGTAVSRVDLLARRSKELGLSPAQQGRLKAIRSASAARQRSLAAQVQSARQAASALATRSNKGETVSLKDVREELAKAGDASRQLDAERRKEWSQALQALTPAQRARVATPGRPGNTGQSGTTGKKG